MAAIHAPACLVWKVNTVNGIKMIVSRHLAIMEQHVLMALVLTLASVPLDIQEGIARWTSMNVRAIPACMVVHVQTL